MKSDYPDANARLAEVAKGWAEGEVSHEDWRKERRTIISFLLTKRSDWILGENKTLPPKKTKMTSSTLPTLKIPPKLLADTDGQISVLFTADVETSEDDVLLLAVLLVATMLTAILLLYVL